MTYDFAATAQEWRFRVRAAFRDLGGLARFATQLPTASGHCHCPATIAVPPPPAGHRPAGDVSGSDTPVLLVHGYLTTEQCWGPLLHRLHRSGFRHTSCLRYNTLTTGIPEIASALARASRAAMDRTASGGVHLIGYSLGGLAVRYAVQHLGLAANALSAVTIGTPHQGTSWAKAALGPAAAQMCPGSEVLASLPDLAVYHQVRWLFLYSDCDPVVPPASATAGRPADAVHVPGRGHLSLLTASRTAELVTTHLCRADFAAAMGVTRRLPDAA
ncbi:hypothetical protein GCM10010129_00380 [Streptomyces fumigatiscleroticus]|nr:hypothetical protein GCM10010129_00380 [Streptomyces fumigatiscleroticus]